MSGFNPFESLKSVPDVLAVLGKWWLVTFVFALVGVVAIVATIAWIIVRAVSNV